MKVLWRRRILAAALSLTAAVGGLFVAGSADAQTVATGSLKFSGDSGDYISGGQSHSYSTSKGDALDVSSANGTTVHVSVNAYNGDDWTLDFDAPGTQDRPVPGHSAVLVPGTYSGAHRYPFNGNGPGLDLSGDGRGCNELTGSFTITKAVFGPDGYVQSFDATFVQHCEGGTRAARGEIHISNPPAPPAPQHATPTNSTATRPGVTYGGAASNPPATPAVAASAAAAARGPFVLIGLGFFAWVVLVVVGLVTGGILMVVRRR
jgi:hypothetical protein